MISIFYRKVGDPCLKLKENLKFYWLWKRRDCVSGCMYVCYMCYLHLTAPGCHVFQAVDSRQSCPLTPNKHSRVRGEDRFPRVLAPWRCAGRFTLPEQGLACRVPAPGWLCPYLCRQRLCRGCPGTGGPAHGRGHPDCPLCPATCLPIMGSVLT